MRAAFARAVAAWPTEVRTSRLCLGRRPVRLMIVGDALARRIGATFAHLCDGGAAGSGPGPAIELWDRSLTGVAPPPLRAAAELEWGRADWRMTTHESHRYIREERPERTGWLDRGAAHLVGTYQSADLSLGESGRPFARMIGQLYRGFGLQRVHAGLVSRDGRGVLFAGPSGSGKTSCTLDCLTGGFAFLGDDSVGVEGGADGAFWGHSLYGSANLLPFHLARAPALAPFVLPPQAPGEDKSLLLPAGVPGCRLARLTRIAAILLPRAGGSGATRIAPAAPTEALPLLLPRGPETLQGGLSAADFARLTALVRRVPCYRLEPGDDPEEVAAAVAGLLDGIAA